MKNALEKHIGKYVIARTRNAGLIFGKVKQLGDGFIELKDARRIFRPISKDKTLAWYEGVAVSGLCEENGMISPTVKTKLLVEEYELNTCSKEAAKSLKEFKSNETTC